MIEFLIGVGAGASGVLIALGVWLARYVQKEPPKVVNWSQIAKK